MKHIVWKVIVNYEKEEKWLNEMSAKGWALTDSTACRYIFSETANNEYTYRLELLDKLPSNPESVAYIKFLEENGVECVSTYARWIYLRRKTSEGPFEIYSDIESKIKHFKRINFLWSLVMCIELIAGLENIIYGVSNQLSSLKISNIIIGCAFVALGIFFFRLGSPIRKNIKRLVEEQAIRE